MRLDAGHVHPLGRTRTRAFFGRVGQWKRRLRWKHPPQIHRRRRRRLCAQHGAAYVTEGTPKNGRDERTHPESVCVAEVPPAVGVAQTHRQCTWAMDQMRVICTAPENHVSPCSAFVRAATQVKSPSISSRQALTFAFQQCPERR